MGKAEAPMPHLMRISNTQLFWIIVTSGTGGNLLLLTITPAIISAKQDAWISMLIAGCGSLAITFLATRISLRYPNQTLVEFSQTILGKWLGKLVVLTYLLAWYTVIGMILSDSSDFIITILFHKTPSWVILLTFVCTLIYAIRQGGVECIGRISELVGPIVSLMVLTVLILNLNNVDWHRMLPVYANSGIGLLFKGAMVPLSFFGQFAFFVMILFPFIDSPRQGATKAVIGVAFAVFLLFLSTLFVIFTFGPGVASKMFFPFFDMTRFISVMEIIQRVDVLYVMAWFPSMFVQVAMFLFLTSYGTAQLLGLKNWRNVTWIPVLIGYSMAILIKNAVVESYWYVNSYWVPYVMTINMIGIPLLLFILGTFRKAAKT